MCKHKRQHESKINPLSDGMLSLGQRFDQPQTGIVCWPADQPAAAKLAESKTIGQFIAWLDFSDLQQKKKSIKMKEIAECLRPNIIE